MSIGTPTPTSMNYQGYTVNGDWRRGTYGDQSGISQSLYYNSKDPTQTFTVAKEPGDSALVNTILAGNGYDAELNKAATTAQYTPLINSDLSQFGSRVAATNGGVGYFQLTNQPKTQVHTDTPEYNSINTAIGNQLGAINNRNSSTPTGTSTSSNDLAGQYRALLGDTSGVDAAQKAIDDQNNAFRTGVHNVQDQPVGMSFISGQAKSLEDRNTDLQIPLQERLASAQQKRQASLDAVKFQLERADKEKQFTADEKYRTASLNKSSNAYTEVSPGASLYDTKNGKSVFTAPTTAQTTASKTLDTSNINAIKLFQSSNGLVADGIVGPKTLAKMAALGISPTGKTSTTTPTTTSLAKRSNESKASFVERALSSQKLNYDTVMKSIPAGMKGVLVNKTGQIGYIPESEYNTAIYTAL